MGSRFMHLVIADYVFQELGLKDRGRTLLGSIAPDSSSQKRISHFKGELHPYAYNSPVDFGRFSAKYRTRFSDDFYIGYLTHLVTDDIWTMKTDFTGFEKRLKANFELYQIYHHDLWLCNAKLNEIYQPQGIEGALSAATEVPTMDEVQAQEVLDYKAEAFADFDYPAENVTQPLELFTLEEMIHYVERCKSKSLDVCRIVLAM